VVVGFRERLSPYVAALDRCEVLASPADALITPLSEMLTGLSIRERLPQIEVAVADNATALVLRVLAPPTPEDLAKLRAFEASHRFRPYLHPAALDSVQRLPLPTNLTAASAAASHPAELPLTYALPAFDVTLEFTPTDFIQINGAINE